jgi:hypothetical protein
MNLLHEMNHMPPVAAKLLWAIERVLRPAGWELASVKGGYNSYVLRKVGEAREYHLRWRRRNEIDVLDSWMYGRVIATVRDNDAEIARFVVGVKTGRL